jgi:hypothetical protein
LYIVDGMSFVGAGGFFGFDAAGTGSWLERMASVCSDSEAPVDIALGLGKVLNASKSMAR